MTSPATGSQRDMHKEAVPILMTLDDAAWRHRVAHAFNRAAPYYNDRASAQLAMGNVLWKRLPLQVDSVLDLGCGPGHWTRRLAQHYRLRPIGLDLATGMLKEAQTRYGGLASWICGDACALPLRNHAIALVFSNLAIQWCHDQQKIFDELYRVLIPNGRALINTLVSGTLSEVAYAWSRPGHSAAVHHFQPAQAIHEAACRSGFQVSQTQVAERFYYPDIASVINSIKGVGAQVARNGSALTRKDLLRAHERYETLREAQGLPLTYQRLTLELFKSNSSP